MTVFGMDSSHYDGFISKAMAAKMVAEGIQFFTAKVSEATNYDDPADGTNLSNLRDAGVKVLGGYHVVRSSGTIKAQVEYYLSLLDRDEPWWRDFPGFFHQVDLELWGYDNVSAARGMDFGKALEDASQKLVVMYASKGMYGNGLRAWKPRPLWNANYPSNRKAGFKALYPGDDGPGFVEYSDQMPLFWQYTSSATIGGLTTCDANAFRGTFDQLYQLITGKHTPADPGGPPVAGFDKNDAHFLLTYAGLPADTPTESLGTAVMAAQKSSASADSKADQILATLKASTGASGVIAIDLDMLRQIIGEEVTKALLASKLSAPAYTITYTQ
jgi:GH25 family lysozyme M1 (1,4-beta-N-acetylmuramidase)